MNNQNYIRTFIYLILFFELIMFRYIPFPTIILYIALTLILYIAYKLRNTEDVENKYIIYITIMYSIISIIRGVIETDQYWGYKTVVQRSFWLLMPILIMCDYRLEIIQKITSISLKYFLWVIPLVYSVMEFSSSTLQLYFFTILLLPFLRREHRYKIIIITIVCLATFIESRSFFARITFAIVIAFTYILFRNYERFISWFQKVLFCVFTIIPLVFLYLAYNGIFNVFAMDEYATKYASNNKDIVADSRSLLYVKVNYELDKKDNFWIGNSASATYMAGEWDLGNKEASKFGRSGVESGFCEQYLIGGAIGCTLYSLIFIFGSFYAIFKSNNIICKILGFYILLRWIVSFADESSSWCVGNIMLYLYLGLCYSKQVRSMSNEEMNNWLKSI